MADKTNSINLMADADSVMKLLECPVCLETIQIPIFQCFQGHLICKNCTKGVKTCPICRDEMPPKPIRNLALEKMTENCEFECRNSTQGCQEKLKQADFTEHGLDCLYETRDFCKHLSLYQNGDNTCNRQIRKTDIADHMKTYHNLKGIAGNKAEMVHTLDSYTQSRMWIPVYFQAHGHENNSVFFVTGGYSHREECAKWNCIFAGSSKSAKAFQVKFTLCTASPKVKLTWEGPVLGMNRTPKDTKQSSFVVPRETLESFCQTVSPKKPEWKIQVNIRKQRVEAKAVAPAAQDVYPSVSSLSVALNDIATNSITSSSSKNVSHKGVTCDGCHIRNIPGIRYKCVQCADYDLCGNCNDKRIHDHHIFFRIVHEAQNFRAYEYFRCLGSGQPSS